MQFTIYHNNAIDSAVLAGDGSWLAALPLENLREQRPTLKARSIDTQDSSTQWTVTLAEPISSHGIQLISTNLSSAALYKITWYTDATFTVEVDNTGFIPVGVSIDWTNILEWLDWLDLNFWLGSTPFLDPDHQGRDVRHSFETPTLVQYLKFEIQDESNSDGFVEIGYQYIGDAYIPSINISFDSSFVRASLTAVQAAIGGSEYFGRRGSRKQWNVVYGMLPETEVFNDIDDIVQIHDVNRSVYVDFDPDDSSAAGAKKAFLARISQLPEYKLLNVFFDDGSGASAGFAFTQVL